ncbi:hypothetical protein FW764_19025 [Pseudomonas sp. 1152_12]
MPAMRTPRFLRNIRVMPSRASPAPTLIALRSETLLNSRRIALCVSSLHWAVTPCCAVVNP